MNKKMAQMGYFFIHPEESDENWKFDKIAGENERNEVQAVAIWKGDHKRSAVGIHNLVTRCRFSPQRSKV